MLASSKRMDRSSSPRRPPTWSDLRPRTVTPEPPRARRESASTAGQLAAAAWLAARCLRAPDKSWDIEIGLDVVDRPATTSFDPKRASRFQLHIYAEEWGYHFCHAGKDSWIRITDIPFVHGSDGYSLLKLTPPLKLLSPFLRRLETEHRLAFQRRHAAIASTIPGSEPVLRSGLLTL